MDEQGSMYVMGTYIPEAGVPDFPITGGPLGQPAPGGQFAAKFSPEGKLVFNVFVAVHSANPSFSIASSHLNEHALVIVLSGESGASRIVQLDRNTGAFLAETQLPTESVSALLTLRDGGLLVTGQCIPAGGSCAAAPFGIRTGTGPYLMRIERDGKIAFSHFLIPGANIPEVTLGVSAMAEAVDGSVMLAAGALPNAAFSPRTLPDAYQTSVPVAYPWAGRGALYLARIRPGSPGILRDTWLGGSGSMNYFLNPTFRHPVQFAILPSGDIEVGVSLTTSLDLPVTSTASLACAQRDAGFLARFDPDLRTLKFGTYLPSGVYAGTDADGRRRFLGASSLLRFDAERPAGPRISCAVSYGHGLPTPLVPGAVTVFRGTGLGPMDLARSSGFPLPRGLAGYTLRVNGAAAPLLSLRDQEVTAIVPNFDGFSPGTPASVTIEKDGEVLAETTMETAAADPGLLLTDAPGIGPVIALNEDGSRNMPSNPAGARSIVTVYSTGLGPLAEEIDLADAPTRAIPLKNLPKFFGFAGSNRPAEVLYAGAAPGLPAGIIQLNIRLPAYVLDGPDNLGFGDSPTTTNGPFRAWIFTKCDPTQPFPCQRIYPDPVIP